MKTWLLIVLTLILGLAAGVGTAMVRLGVSSRPDDLTGAISSGDPRMPSVAAPSGPQPEAVIDNEDYDFGIMDSNAKGRHEFIFTNKGKGPLVLTEGDSSCKCTVMKLDESTIAPGKSTKVALEWTCNEFSGPFRQSAVIFTNDPEHRRITLTIFGQVEVALRVVPRELVFGRVASGQTVTAEGRIYCHLKEPLEIVEHVLSDRQSADHFQIDFEPLPAKQIAEEKGAKSGYLVRVTVEPGLPLGAFEQRILISTNQESAPSIDISVRGNIGSDISIVGRGWNSETGVLNFGTVSGNEGARRTVMLVARGSHRKELKFKPILVVPDDVLKVELGKTTPINKGAVTQTPVIIQIPKGSRAANHLGSEQGRLGEVLIETNHPQAPKLRIFVQFAVEGDG